MRTAKADSPSADGPQALRHVPFPSGSLVIGQERKEMTKQEIQSALKAATDKAARLNALAERTEEQDQELDAAIAEAEGHVASLDAIREREAADAQRKAKIG